MRGRRRTDRKIFVYEGEDTIGRKLIRPPEPVLRSEANLRTPRERQILFFSDKTPRLGRPIKRLMNALCLPRRRRRLEKKNEIFSAADTFPTRANRRDSLQVNGSVKRLCKYLVYLFYFIEWFQYQREIPILIK